MEDNSNNNNTNGVIEASEQDSKENTMITSISSYEELHSEQLKNEQNQKIENLKTLLVKAKTSIQKFRGENIQLQKEIKEYKEKNAQMEVLIQKYLDEGQEEGGSENNAENKKNKKISEKILEIQAKIVLNGINWACVKFENYNIEWVREENLDLENFVKSEENQSQQIIEMPTCIDYNRFASKEQQQQEKSKNFDQDLKNVIDQYEERIKRLHENQDIQESKIAKMNKKMTLLKQKLEDNKVQVSEFSNTLIDESETIRENCLQFMAEENTDESSKKEQMQQIKFFLIKLQKMDFQYEQDCFNNLKDHILILHQTLFDLLKKSKLQREDHESELKTWKVNLERCKQQLGIERKEKNEILEQGRKKIKELETTSEKYKSQTILEMKEKDVKIEFLNKELNKNVNNLFVKNILIKFFLAEKKVQKKMLNGIATVLQFTEDEVQEVSKALFEQEQGGISGFFGFGQK